MLRLRGIHRRVVGTTPAFSPRVTAASSSSSPLYIPRRFVSELTDAELRAQVFHPRPSSEVENEAAKLVESPEFQNQYQWYLFYESKYQALAIGVFILGIGIISFYYKKESNHFLHHRHRQEPYPFFMDRSQQVGVGFWPGRACQFMEFNCYSAAYAAADQLLAEKHQQGGGGHGDDHEDEEDHGKRKKH